MVMRGCFALLLAFSCTVLSFHPQKSYYCGTTDPAPIPPLDIAGLSLVQVQTFIRHGDRTICSPGKCWPNDDAVYNCSLTYLLQSNTQPDDFEASVPRLFRKEFLDGRNIYKGNCQMGQLTVIGHDQEVANGKLLRAAYVEGGVQRLLPTALTLSNAPSFFFRSDDNTRTVQSGMALVEGLYPAAASAGDDIPIVNWRTMDEATDSMDPDGSTCPPLEQAESTAMESKMYQRYNSSIIAPLMAYLDAQLGDTGDAASLSHLVDCYHVHSCHDFSVPQAFSNLTMVKQLEDTKTWAKYYVINATRKYKIGPLLSDVYTHLTDLIAAVSSAPQASGSDSDSDSVDDVIADGDSGRPSLRATAASAAAAATVRAAQEVQRTTRRPRSTGASATPYPFVLYSGHDTGPIMGLVASLFEPLPPSADGYPAFLPWPRYATMILLEVYRVDAHAHAHADADADAAVAAFPSGFAVRVLYNSEVQRLQGMDADVVDYDAFLSLLKHRMTPGTACGWRE